MSDQLWDVYIIKTTKDRLYTGIARDADKRFLEHLNDPKKGAKFFRLNTPQEIVYREKAKNRSEASIRESEIKKMSREQKLQLISSS